MPDSPIGMDRGSLSVVPPVSGARKHGRGMQPTRGHRLSPQEVKDGHTVVRENTGVVPLSVEVEEFSLRTVPKNRVPMGRDWTVVGTVCLLGRCMEE